MAQEFVGLFAFVVMTGLIHGAEPGHGWPVAAAYAFDSSSPWSRGLAASLVLGIGHLVSAVVVVLGFFWFKSEAGLGKVPWLNYVAGSLLILLGVYEYVSGGHHHAHDHGDGHSHEHGDGHAHDHSHGPGRSDHDHGPGAADLGAVKDVDAPDTGHSRSDGGIRPRLKSLLPGSGHDHDHLSKEDATEKGLWGIAWTAFVLGFAHEEEFELIGICTGTNYCVQLTLVYAVSVVVALVGLTALLLAGYERYEDRMEEYAEHFPTISAAVLILMGLGFLLGVF